MTIFIPEKHVGALKTKNKVADKAKAKKAYDALHGRVERNLLDLKPYVKELVFHPKRKWRFDYAWPDLKIALEVHGGVHRQGRHTRGKGFISDREKMNEAQLLGWIVIEISPEQISQMRDWLFRAMEARVHAPDKTTNQSGS